jgi:hypothetical protein
MERDTGRHGQEHRQIGTGKQTERDRDTEGQGEGHRLPERDSGVQGEG